MLNLVLLGALAGWAGWVARDAREAARVRSWDVGPYRLTLTGELLEVELRVDIERREAVEQLIASTSKAVR